MRDVQRSDGDLCSMSQAGGRGSQSCRQDAVKVKLVTKCPAVQVVLFANVEVVKPPPNVTRGLHISYSSSYRTVWASLPAAKDEDSFRRGWRPQPFFSPQNAGTFCK